MLRFELANFVQQQVCPPGGGVVQTCQLVFDRPHVPAHRRRIEAAPIHRHGPDHGASQLVYAPPDCQPPLECKCAAHEQRPILHAGLFQRGGAGLRHDLVQLIQESSGLGIGQRLNRVQLPEEGLYVLAPVRRDLTLAKRVQRIDHDPWQRPAGHDVGRMFDRSSRQGAGRCFDRRCRLRRRCGCCPRRRLGTPWRVCDRQKTRRGQGRVAKYALGSRWHRRSCAVRCDIVGQLLRGFTISAAKLSPRRGRCSSHDRRVVVQPRPRSDHRYRSRNGEATIREPSPGGCHRQNDDRDCHTDHRPSRVPMFAHTTLSARAEDLNVQAAQ